MIFLFISEFLASITTAAANKTETKTTGLVAAALKMATATNTAMAAVAKVATNSGALMTVRVAAIATEKATMTMAIAVTMATLLLPVTWRVIKKAAKVINAAKACHLPRAGHQIFRSFFSSICFSFH